MSKKSKVLIWILGVLAVFIAIATFYLLKNSQSQLMTLNDFDKNVVEKYTNKGFSIQTLKWESSNNLYYVTGEFISDNKIYTFSVYFSVDQLNRLGDDTTNKFWDLLNSKGTYAEQSTSILSYLGSEIWMIVYIAFLMWFLYSTSKSAGGGLFGVQKSKPRETKSSIKFSDVAGIDEEKEELIELVDYLKNPTKYSDCGARIPKGVLMEGPPGTGKTLLAKAVAGEANVSFFLMAGSEFEEMFVGLGASRVRDLFADAKKAAPCIIFIDEIDAVGRKRNNSMNGTSEQTLNQLLVEMDGFEMNSGVIVMAATNRVDVLDPALLRPGRFDRTIQISLPDIKEREAILKLHSRNKKISNQIEWKRIAERTPGFSGAQLENVLNEAAILVVRRQGTEILLTDIDEAIDRVVGGPAKKSRAMTVNDKNIVSYHEAGHALIGLVLKSASKVQKVTIIPRGNAGGYTIMTPKEETNFSSKEDLYGTITGYLGGRAAEEIILGKDKITTGAHDDLDKATNIARKMVTQFGMSSLGLPRLVSMNDEAMGNPKGVYSEEIASKIDAEISKILSVCYQMALKTIKGNLNILELIAESLRILETITAEQVEYIYENKKLPDEVIKQKQSKE